MLLYEFTGKGMAVLLSTPCMDEAARCHRVGLIHAGRLLAEGGPDALVRAFDHATLEVELAPAGAGPGDARARLDRVIAQSPEIAVLKHTPSCPEAGTGEE